MVKKTPKLKIVKAKVVKPTRLDLGCGRNKQEGFFGVDLYEPDADLKLDLFQSNWPWKDNTVDEIFCSHFVEHIPHFNRWKFFEECYRIMKLDATMRILVPSWKSERSYGDMTHQWPPVTAFFFYYLNKDWRTANKLTYGPYALKCHFESQAGPTAISPAFADRTQEAQTHACTHYLEAYGDMWVTLVKKAL
jgi:ubiquinone/menaquinone biosynthesis C-methylase UbiE